MGTISEDHVFVASSKQIKSPMDMARWEKSQAYSDYMQFICNLSEAVKGKKMTDPYPVSDFVTRCAKLLTKLDDWITEIPPMEQPTRFGNKSYRTWFQRVEENAPTILKELLDEKSHSAVVELQPYLMDSFGNSTRIDYGTGHEMAFIMFLLCLCKMNAFHETDSAAIVFTVFQRYMELVRRLQTVYNMEPAGSHGVWSLDDFQFVPFIWGSAQFIGHPKIMPSHFVKPDYYENFDGDFMFFGCIKFICSVKKGPFAEHSNQLWNISGVPMWTKVNQGLVKMYQAEVLAKFPVVQHVFFGSLLTLKPAAA